jgi:hypothetical protein
MYQVYPTAYLEFVEGEDGKKYRQGPRNEKDETVARDRWKVSFLCVTTCVLNKDAVGFIKGQKGSRRIEATICARESDLQTGRVCRTYGTEGGLKVSSGRRW